MSDEWYSDSDISISPRSFYWKQMALLDHKGNGAAFYYFAIGFIEQAKAVLMSAVCWVLYNCVELLILLWVLCIYKSVLIGPCTSV